MALGYGADGTCFKTAQEAVDAHWSSQPVTTSPATTSSIWFSHHHIWNGNTWQRVTDRCTMSASTPTCTRGTSTVPTYTPTSCTLNNDLDSFTDGNVLGWLVVGVMVAAWAITILRRAI